MSRDQKDEDTHRARRRANGPFDGLSGALGGLSEIVERLREVSEAVRQEGEFSSEDGRVSAKWGFHINTAGGNSSSGQRPSAMPNHRGAARPRRGAPPRQRRSRVRTVEVGGGRRGAKPRVEVMEEKDHALVIIEMSGYAPDSLTWEVDGAQLFLEIAPSEEHPTGWRDEVVLASEYAQVYEQKSGPGCVVLRLEPQEAP